MRLPLASITRGVVVHPTAIWLECERLGVRHVVLEQERAFSQWYRRWDSFHMNTANRMNALPSAPIEFAPESGRNELGSKADALRYLEAYLSAVDPPLRDGAEVTSVVQQLAKRYGVELVGKVRPLEPAVRRLLAFSRRPYPLDLEQLQPQVPHFGQQAVQRGLVGQRTL